jgi:hypothetical protein
LIEGSSGGASCHPRWAKTTSAGVGRLRAGPGQIHPSSPREDAVAVSRLPNVCLVLITPDSSEIRWVSAVPEPGVRIHGRFPGAWLIVDEVVQSGVMTYTVFGSTAPEGLIDQARDLAADAVDRVQESVGRSGRHLPLPPVGKISG